MSKKLIFVFGLVFFFSIGNFAFANLSINEINYDLSGSDSLNSKSREWIEVYNSGPTDVSIDASKWRFYDGGANRTINGEVNFTIPANSYVIFAGDKATFLADHSNFTGAVYDTGFTSLNNTGASLKILDQDGNTIDEVTYATSLGGAGDGNSLQKISGSWVGATPTPGAANEAVSNPPQSVPVAGSSGGSSSSSVLTTNTTEPVKVAEVPKIKTQITAKTLGFVNLPIVLDATTLGYGGEQLNYGKYFWNFGDGDSKEIQLNSSKKFTHTYFYPGDYVVSLSYYSNYYSDIPDATNQINIKIVDADISISSVGDEKDFFVELSNNTDYSADLSNWFLAADGKSFLIPRNTILASKKKMIISPKITSFSFVDKSTLKLMNPEREVVFDYAALNLANTAPAKVVLATSSNSNSQGRSLREISQGPSFNSEEIIPTNNLEANAIQSNTSESDSNISYWPILILIILVGSGTAGVYFIRRKKVIPGDGDDFEILDE